MATWITPIIDRTQQDVDRIKALNAKGYFNLTAEEKAEWAQDSKGCLNSSDLNRIENNIKVISDILGMSVSLVTVPEIPNQSYYSNLRSRVNQLRTKAVAYKYSTQVPNQPLNHYWKWNEIETLLLDMFTVLTDNEKAILYITEDVELYLESEVI